MQNNNGIGKATTNPFAKNNKILISRVPATPNIKKSILHAVDLIGGFEKIVEAGDEILVKPNYNSADPPPASTDPEFLRAVGDLLYEHGAGKVIVGESSMQRTSTCNVMEKTGTLTKLKDSDAEVVFFTKKNGQKHP